jgi:hypothetical protein
VNYSDLEDLNAKYRIATLRYARFMDSLKGLDLTDRDKDEATRLEDEMKEAERGVDALSSGARVLGTIPSLRRIATPSPIPASFPSHNPNHRSSPD